MTAAVPEIRAAQVRDVTAIAAIDPRAHHRAEEIRALVREHASLVAVDGGLFFHDRSTEECWEIAGDALSHLARRGVTARV